ncbi:Interleukin-20, partial [Camelus dromedarius]
QTKDEILDIRILKKTHSLQDTTPAYQCCLLRHILRLYLDRVFQNYQTPDHHVLRKVSSLANSFLAIKKDLRLCVTCPFDMPLWRGSNGKIQPDSESLRRGICHFGLGWDECVLRTEIIGKKKKKALLTIPNSPTSGRRGLLLEDVLSLYDLLTTAPCVFQLQPQAAVVKALGELDILLRWIEAID